MEIMDRDSFEDVYHASVIEILQEREGDGKAEQPDDAEQLQAGQHAGQGYDRMEPHLMAHDLGLDDVADHGDDEVEDQKPDAVEKVSCDQRDHRPWDHDASGAKNRKNIENGDAHSDQNGIRHAQ